MTSKTRDELFGVALADLAHGRRQAAERLPVIARTVAADDLRHRIEALAERYGSEGDELAGSGDDNPPPNLWANGILDDAERDTRSTSKGDIRDIALIGAIRKLLAADDVSLDTAIALANTSGMSARLSLMQAQTRFDSAALLVQLARIAGAQEKEAGGRDIPA